MTHFPEFMDLRHLLGERGAFSDRKFGSFFGYPGSEDRGSWVPYIHKGAPLFHIAGTLGQRGALLFPFTDFHLVKHIVFVFLFPPPPCRF